jgi:hypothetical protein
LVASVAVAIGPDDGDVPWARMGMVVAIQLLACGATLLRDLIS